MQRIYKLSVVFFALLISLACGGGKTTYHTGPYAQAGPASVALMINSQGDIVLSGELASPKLIGFGPVGVGWTAGFEQLVYEAEKTPQALFILWEDESGIIKQKQYDIDQPFEVTFGSNDWVRKIERLDNGSIVVAVEYREMIQVVSVPTSVPDTDTQLPNNPPSEQSCSIPVASSFTTVWQRGGGARTSCPTGAAFGRAGAYEYFENGLMVWHAGPSGDTGGMIYVIYNSGKWQEYPDTWAEGQLDRADYDPPSGLLEPQRGFGKVWRDKLGGPSASIGWATHIEQRDTVTVQPFSGTGVILSFSKGVYFLPHGTSWVQ